MPPLFQKIYFEKRKNIRILFFLLADIVLIASAVLLAFLVRFEGEIPEQYWLNILSIVVLAEIITIILFFIFKLYSFTWIYVSASELLALSKATVLSLLILTATFFILRDHVFFRGFPRSALFITYFFIFFLSGFIRFAKRIYLESFPGVRKEKTERTLIAGAGRAGEQILRSILNLRKSNYQPVGFIDDDPGKQGILIHGIKVLGKIQDIPRLALKEKIDGLIIALPSAGQETIKRAVEGGRLAKLKKIKIVPSIFEVNLGRLQEVAAEDLLGREAVSLNESSEIEAFIRDKKVLVTGASGSIGSELCRQIIKFNPQSLFILDQDETGIFNISKELKNKFPGTVSFIADITDEKRMKWIFDKCLPGVVFHAAAYKHVSLMEENVSEAIKNNVFGTKILVKEAFGRDNLEKFIFISTDKAVNPSSVMGATKRLGEMICQTENQKGKVKFVSVRFGNVLDSRGNVVQIFREQIEKRKRGEPSSIEITHPDMRRYFMTTSEACLLVLQASAMGQGGEVFVLDMGKPVKIVDLAKEMIKLSGLEADKDIPIIFTGIRAGEKLLEEMLTAEEGTSATKNQKIFTVKPSFPKENLEKRLEELKELIDKEEKESIMGKLKEIIPSYK